MSKFSITLGFDTHAEAIAFLASQGSAPSTPFTPQAAPTPPAAAPAPPQVQVGPGPTPPPAAAFTPAPPPAAAPAPGPAPAAPGGNMQDAMAAMQAYNAHYKAPGTKAAFAKADLPPSLQQLNAEQLAYMTQFFRAMQPA